MRDFFQKLVLNDRAGKGRAAGVGFRPTIMWQSAKTYQLWPLLSELTEKSTVEEEVSPTD